MEIIQTVQNLNLTKDKQSKVNEKRKLFSRPESALVLVLQYTECRPLCRLLWTEFPFFIKRLSAVDEILSL